MYMHVYMYVCVYRALYVYKHIYIYIYIYIYISIMYPYPPTHPHSLLIISFQNTHIRVTYTHTHTHLTRSAPHLRMPNSWSEMAPTQPKAHVAAHNNTSETTCIVAPTAVSRQLWEGGQPQIAGLREDGNEGSAQGKSGISCHLQSKVGPEDASSQPASHHHCPTTDKRKRKLFLYFPIRSSRRQNSGDLSERSCRAVSPGVRHRCALVFLLSKYQGTKKRGQLEEAPCLLFLVIKTTKMHMPIMLVMAINVSMRAIAIGPFIAGHGGVGGEHLAPGICKYPDLARCGCVFGRVAMGIRAGGIGEGAGGVTNFTPPWPRS
jgi:hypothetical protein